MKKQYYNPQTVLLQFNVPIHMADIEGSSAAKLKDMKVGGTGFPTSEPTKTV